MTLSNITSIYKRSGSKQDMSNQRGIFSLTIFKKILDNLLLNDLYNDVDNGMSESNIGGRRKRMAKDHLFVLYGVINSVNNDKNEDSIDVLVYDVEKAFDKLFLDDCINDLIDTLPKHKETDKISLLHKSNESTKVSVNTPFGQTKRQEYKNIVQQGGGWGGILCSNSVDTVEKSSLLEPSSVTNYNPYVYEKKLKVPLLSYIDDTNNISKCGLNALKNNIFITSQIEMKRLKFNVGTERKKSKCQKLHVGKDASNCIPLHVNKKQMDEVHEISYLGDLVNGFGSNMSNIKNRVSKSRNTIMNIFSILENMCFGPHYFRVALLLRESMLISSATYNADVWYSLNQNELNEFSSPVF